MLGLKKRLKERVGRLEMHMKSLLTRDELQYYRNKEVEKQFKDISTQLDDISNGNLKESAVIECESCGCLVLEKTAIKGKSEIRKKNVSTGKQVFDTGTITTAEEREYIYTPYYCKICGEEKGGWK